MKIYRITAPPPPELARKLAAFEKEFQYPLGPDDSFTISHGKDYSMFFRGMGKARIHLAEISGAIVGALAVVEGTVSLAHGGQIPAAYFCDAKVVSQMRGKMVLGRLAMDACRETLSTGIQAGFSVVMEGSKTSDQYTGRLGIPQFHELGRIVILRFNTEGEFSGFPSAGISGVMAFHRPESGSGALCSEMEPRKLSVSGATGTLLDTRRGKRLHRSDGSEMVSAHLTGLNFEDTEGLSAIIRLASKTAAEMDIPGLFVSLPENLFAHDVLRAAVGKSTTIANATVFGTGLPEGDWMVNTSEI